jgi:predicted MFS family arabinose efflux permease
MADKITYLRNKDKFVFRNALNILIVSNSLILLAGAMLGPIYVLFVQQVGGDFLDASFAGGIFAVAAGIVVLLSGKVSDIVEENELIMVFGYAIMGVSFLLYMFVSSVWHLLLVQVLMGLGDAIYSPAFDALYSRHVEAKRGGSQWGIWESMRYFVTAVGAMLGGLTVAYFNFQVLFLIMAAFCFGSAIFIFFLPRNIL